MNSEVSAEKSRKNASRLPSETKSQSLRLSSGNRDKQQKSEQDPGQKHWTLNSEGFPPGVTVDELKNYRRRRQINDIIPKDNLHPEEGSLKSYKSEYNRRYKAHITSDVSNVEKDLTSRKSDLNSTKEEKFNFLGEHKELFTDFPRTRPLLKRPQCNLNVLKDVPMESSTEKNSQFVLYDNVERRKLLRRSTALKPEGEMVSETEVRSQFREYENPEKAIPIRRPPSLKIEGEFENLTSEQKEKFIVHLLEKRPVLKKKNTLLKMEGDFDFLTEKQVNYVQHDWKERPFPRKRSTSLKLDGEVEFFPEYRSSYIDFPRSRPITYKPLENLRNEGEIDSQTETKTKYIDYQQFPVPLPVRPFNNLHIEGGLDIRPEYKENFIDFPRSRPFTIRPEDHLKQEGDFDMKTEKSDDLSKILTEVKRPLGVRRPSNLKLEGELEFSTEKREQFKGHEITERLPPARREGSLLLEGEFNFKTENEDKYVANAIPERSDFRKRSSFLHSGGEFQSVFEYGRSSPRGSFLSPNRSRATDGQVMKSKSIPFKTEHFGMDSELMENCNRRSSRRNSKRLKESFADPFVARSPIMREEKPKPEEDLEKYPEFGSRYVHDSLPGRRRLPPNDSLRLETEVQSSCLIPQEKTIFEQAKVGEETFKALQAEKGRRGRDDTAPEDTSDSGSVTSHQPSFRLEVYNVDANPQGFHRGSQRIFPPEGIPTDTIHFGPDSFLEKRRNEYYGKTVNCPDVPNCILDKNNNFGTVQSTGLWEMPRKTDDCSLDVLNAVPRHSRVADLSDEKLTSSDTAADTEPETWSRPNWLTT